VLTLPGFIVSDADIPYGHFVVLTLYQRDAEQLPAVRTGNFTAIAPGALLEMFVRFQNKLTGGNGVPAPGDRGR
jgi:hypothetical protein